MQVELFVLYTVAITNSRVVYKVLLESEMTSHGYKSN